MTRNTAVAQAQAAFQEDAPGLWHSKHEQQTCIPDPVSDVDLPLSEASKTTDAQPFPEELNIQQAFAGQTVLLTGVTGFVGSIVLEQLLRTCPNVRKVYVIVRDKNSMSGPERLQHMLRSSPLFQAHGSPATTDTVSSISNDQRLTSNKAAASDSQDDDAQVFDGQSPLLQSHNSPATADAVSIVSNDNILTSGRAAAVESPEDHSPNSCAERNGSVPVEAISGDMTLQGYGIAESDLHRLQLETDIVIHAAASISFDDHIHDAITHNYMVCCDPCCIQQS